MLAYCHCVALSAKSENWVVNNGIFLNHTTRPSCTYVDTKTKLLKRQERQCQASHKSPMSVPFVNRTRAPGHNLWDFGQKKGKKRS